MATAKSKIKGLYVRFNCISQIFVVKERELEIGYPTDVKHVAHVGWDGDSGTAPNWMNEFKTASDFTATSIGVKMTTLSLTSPCIVKAAVQDRFTSVIVKAPTSFGSVKSISKSFGLKCSSNYRTVMAASKIKLVGPNGELNEFEAADDQYILDATEEAGVDLPFLAGLELAACVPGR